MNMKHKDYTPEEILKMWICNENFQGTRANLEKVRLYHTIKTDLTQFMQDCDEVRRVEGFDPNPKEKHAVIWIDLVPAATLSKEETTKLTKIMNKSDGTVISAVGDHVRISFDINDIWLD